MSELPDPASFGDYATWPGREVHGPGGRVGTVVEIYLDDATDRPEWVLVELEEGSRFVPLAGGGVDGETIRVAHSARAVGAAPDFALTKELSQDQERQLYDHYAVPVSEDASDSLLPDPEAEPESGQAGAAAPPTADAAPAAVHAPQPDPTPEPEPEPTPEPAAAPEPAAQPTPAPSEPEPAEEPVAALPPEGETSEPEKQGPPVPPRPEPVAPAPPPPTTPPPPPPYAETQQGGGQPPATIIATAAALAILLLIIVRRRR